MAGFGDIVGGIVNTFTGGGGGGGSGSQRAPIPSPVDVLTTLTGGGGGQGSPIPYPVSVLNTLGGSLGLPALPDPVQVFGAFTGGGAGPGAQPGAGGAAGQQQQQDTTKRLYCIPRPGYPNVIEQAGPVGPEWGNPLSAALGLKAGDPCPGAQQAQQQDTTVRQYCIPRPGYPNVIEQAGPVGPEWGNPLSAALGLRAGDPCPGQQAQPAQGYDDQYGGPGGGGGVAYGAPFEDNNGGGLGGLFGGLPAGAFGGNGPPDWFWMLWLIEHMNDADKSPARAAQDWESDARNPAPTGRTFTAARPAQVDPRYAIDPRNMTRLNPPGPTYTRVAPPIRGTPQVSVQAQPPRTPQGPNDCASGQLWNALTRKCEPSASPIPARFVPHSLNSIGQIGGVPTAGGAGVQVGGSGQVGFPAAPNTGMINPRTGMPFMGV